MKKWLIINDRSRKIKINNREVRTPTTIEIKDEKHLKQLTIALKAEGIENYSVEIESEINFEEVPTIDEPIEEKEVVVFNEKSEPVTTLDKYMNGE
jgi:hypothetical protein